MRTFVPINVGITDEMIFRIIEQYCQATNQELPYTSPEQLDNKFCEKFASEIYDFTEYLVAEDSKLYFEIRDHFVASFLMKDHCRKLQESGLIPPHDDSHVEFYKQKMQKHAMTA